eukprot:CAMPEP_0174818332 /NCGR_PEP_ID=MMETSP1107-20130205/990_1 /TAXON_ID=36770 /ORGANISM="Paraphysomonas vestita, Strain GFlagA" /LENGTH=616 /DNA_ID=CAMNT_0016030025 /DNA_START=209 /DNA_END=2055 /DNA_ORIENTATION=+
MATKIKELGFLGDCGYNQLLYPVEAQTRTLLNWLVQRLPRTEDNAAEDTLSGNALLNKRILESISSWKSAPWRLHVCTKGNKNFYYRRPAVTTPASDVRGIYAALSSTSGSVSTSIFERHAKLLSRDAEYAKRLESDFNEENGKDSSNVTNLVNAAFASAKQQSRAGPSASTLTSGAKGGVGTGTSESRESTLVNKTLQEIISEMSNDGSDTGSKLDIRGTRFTHSTAFSQENNVSLLVSGPGSGPGAILDGTSGKSATSSLKTTNRKVNAEDDDDDDLGPIDVRTSSLAAIARSRAEQRKQQQEEEDRKRLQEVEEARDLVAEAEVNVEELERQQNNTASKTRQLENEVASLQQLGEKLEREILLKRKTLEMLPSAADNIGKLQAICANSAKRLMQLAQEWETHRRPLIDKLRDIKSSKTKRRALCKKMIEDMKKCREEMVAMMQELKDKQEKSQVLLEEVSKLPRNINRTMYTYRIMDIIASIAKQNKDINKITADIRDVQKTINMNMNILSRADAVAEDKIYSAANSSTRTAGMVDAYRNLTSLRGNFELLIDTVNKIGQLDMQARDLETKIDQEVARVSANNFDRIKADLEEIQKENQRLVGLIKAARGRGR